MPMNSWRDSAPSVRQPIRFEEWGAVMKGVIVVCLGEMVTEKFGEDTWRKILTGAGMDADKRFLPISDVDDSAVMKVVEETCNASGLSLQQAADAFGEYWACTYASRLYGAYYMGVTSAKEFLLKLDGIHVATTRTVPNAQPPRFNYEDVDDHTLIMEYRSSRGLMPFFAGLVRGIATHYGERANITDLGANRVKIELSPA